MLFHYGKRCVAFEDDPQGDVNARFEDGSTTTGDMLIGADGAGSHLRAQLLPHARRAETGIVAVSAKLRLSDDVRRATPQSILRGPTLILGPKGCFMFASTVDYEDKPPGGEQHYDHEKYVMWGFSAPNEMLDLPANPATVSGQDAKAAVVAQMGLAPCSAMARANRRRIDGHCICGEDISAAPTVGHTEGDPAWRRAP